VAVSYKPSRIYSIPPFFHRICISHFFSSTLSSITSSFRRPFQRYINDLSFLCAIGSIGSSQEPPNPVRALYKQTKPRDLRQQPHTTRKMPIPIYLHAPPPPHPRSSSLSSIFLHLPHKHTTQDGRYDDDQTAHKTSSKAHKRKDVQVAACLIPASYWERVLIQFSSVHPRSKNPYQIDYFFVKQSDMKRVRDAGAVNWRVDKDH
jgi:hypothetical protein